MPWNPTRFHINVPFAVVLKIRFKWNTLYVIKQCSLGDVVSRHDSHLFIVWNMTVWLVGADAEESSVATMRRATRKYDKKPKRNLKMSGIFFIANQRFILSHVFAGSTWTHWNNGSNGKMKFTSEWWSSSNANSWICTLLSPHSYRGELKWSFCVWTFFTQIVERVKQWNTSTSLFCK